MNSWPAERANMTVISRHRDSLMTSNPRRPEIALIVATKRGHCQCFEQSIAELKCLG